MIVQEITTTAALERLAPEWADLWAADSSATPFQSPQWLLPWWRWLGRGGLWTLCVRTSDGSADGGRLVGLLPLYVYAEPDSGLRKLLPLGVATSDYLGGVFAPEWASRAAAAALAHLAECAERWDVCELTQLGPDSPLLTLPPTSACSDLLTTGGGPARVPWTADRLPVFVRSAGFSPYFLVRSGIRAEARTTNADDGADGTGRLSPAHGTWDGTGPDDGIRHACADERGESDPSLVLRLPDRVEDLPAQLPPQIAHNLHYYRRRAEREGRVEIEPADAGNVHELYGALVDLHRARWAARGKPGVLADEAIRGSHREALPGLLEAGMLRMSALRLNGRIIAVLFGLIDGPPAVLRAHRRAYYYLGGFDPAYDRLSPGTLLIGHAIEQATREGAASFDFLRGREPYKYRWGATEQPTYRRRLSPHRSDPAEDRDAARLSAHPSRVGPAVPAASGVA